MSKKDWKYHLQCLRCGQEIESFKIWFDHGQRCPGCGNNRADVQYADNMANIEDFLQDKSIAVSGLWRYFDYLPLNSRDNIVSCGEGLVPIDRWRFLE